MKNYFSIQELCKTETGFDNSVHGMDVMCNLSHLHFVLNIIRHLVGCPITVNSAFRSPEVNAAVGGVENSKHLFGLAADISCRRPASLKDICRQFYKAGIFSEFVVHDTYIHVAL